jgi:hypothetical protein
MLPTLEELCDGLRTNDPSITDVSIPVYDRSRLIALLKALQGNVRVSSLTLVVSGSPPMSDQQCTGLCRYLSESKVLRSVTFTSTVTCSGWSGLPGTLVRALTGNSLIQEVAFRGVAVPKYRDFLAFLQSKAQSLKRLSIPYVQWTDELRLAIGSLQALECFTMIHSVDCPMEYVLQQLQSYRRLRKLSITARYFLLDDTIVGPLSCLFCSEIPLESLELNYFEFSRDCRDHLVPLLHAIRSCSTLVRLVLTGDWEVETVCDLVAWLHQPRESSLRELGLGGCYSSDASAISLLTPPEGCSQQSSVGSLLQVLELDSPFIDIAVLLVGLTSQISTLSLGSLNRAASWQLTRYLPDMMNLRNLHVKRIWDCDPATLPPAFRRNGSLQSVSFHSVGGWGFFGTAEKRRIQSYCDRNRCAHVLLQKLDDGGPTHHHADATSLCLCPLLLHAVKPAWRMAPSAFLGGLVACKEAIGPRERVKRVAS